MIWIDHRKSNEEINPSQSHLCCARLQVKSIADSAGQHTHTTLPLLHFHKPPSILSLFLQMAQNCLQCSGQVGDPLLGLSEGRDPGSAARGQRCSQHRGRHSVRDTAAGRRCIWGRTLSKCGSLWKRMIKCFTLVSYSLNVSKSNFLFFIAFSQSFNRSGWTVIKKNNTFECTVALFVHFCIKVDNGNKWESVSWELCVIRWNHGRLVHWGNMQCILAESSDKAL